MYHISHDRYFLDNMVDRIFAFEGNGRLKQYEGGYTEYLEAKGETSVMEKTVVKTYKAIENGVVGTYKKIEDKFCEKFLEQDTAGGKPKLKSTKVEKAVVNGYKTIENGVVKGYKSIEKGVVDGYKTIETNVVESYKEIETDFINNALEKKEDKSSEE